MPPHVYITVWEDLQNIAQMYMQRKKAELLFSLQYCCCRRRHVLEMLCFEGKVLFLGFQKTQLEISG